MQTSLFVAPSQRFVSGGQSSLPYRVASHQPVVRSMPSNRLQMPSHKAHFGMKGLKNILYGLFAILLLSTQDLSKGCHQFQSNMQSIGSLIGLTSAENVTAPQPAAQAAVAESPVNVKGATAEESVEAGQSKKPANVSVSGGKDVHAFNLLPSSINKLKGVTYDDVAQGDGYAIRNTTASVSTIQHDLGNEIVAWGAKYGQCHDTPALRDAVNELIQKQTSPLAVAAAEGVFLWKDGRKTNYKPIDLLAAAQTALVE